jgi:polyhydroxybutyrate depolymerase
LIGCGARATFAHLPRFLRPNNTASEDAIVKPSAAVKLLFVFPLFALSGCVGAVIAVATTAAASTATVTPCEGAGATEARCESLDFGGIKRTYRIYAPAEVAAGAPLLLVLHGAKNDGGSMEIITAKGFNRRADQAGAVVVYPDGVAHHWNDGRAALPSRVKQADDVGFLRALVASLSQRYPIAPDRVFVSGFSNGGMMTLRLACEATDVFQGFVAVGASLSEGLAANCHPQLVRRVALIDGTADAIVPYTAGSIGLLGGHGRVIGAEATFAMFRALAGCSGVATKPSPEEATHNPSDVVVHEAIGCLPHTRVVLFEIKGGGHAWPGASHYPHVNIFRGKVSRDLDTTEEVWRFFELPGAHD